MNDQGHAEREHFFGAERLVAGITLLSRVLGLIRDVAIVAFGANRATDAFWTAFRVPNVSRRLFGEGAISAAFVPVFTETAETEGWDRARVVLANCMGLLALLLKALVVIVELALAGVLIFAPGEWDRTLLVQLIMIVLPFTITICLLALGSAGLNCKGHFAYPAFAPILLNVFLIAGAFVAHKLFGPGRWEGLFTLSISVIVAGVVQLAGVFWLLRSAGLAVIPHIRPVAIEVKRIAALTLPMMVPLGMMQISSLFDSFYAWFMTATQEAPTLEILGQSISRPLAPGVVTCLYAAERLQNFPLGIFALSLATAVFPLFSRYAARSDFVNLREAATRAVRMSLFIGIPAGLALILLARPIIVLIYRWGEFRPTDAARSAVILQMYCLGMWAYFLRHILLRVFFARKDASTPMKISCVLTVANILLVAFGIFTPLKAAAIGLATALTASLNVLVLGWILHRRWRLIEVGQIASSLVRTLVATALMCLAVGFVYYLCGRTDLAPKQAAMMTVAIGVPAGIAVFVAVGAVLRCRELAELLRTVRRRQDAENQDRSKL